MSLNLLDLRYLFYIILIVLIFLAGYYTGSRHSRKDVEKTALTSYSYVRKIAELGTLELNGISQLKRTNVDAGDESWMQSLRKKMLEQTVNLAVPYRAKYGINMQDTNFRIIRRDSVVLVYLPMPRLLSVELKLDAMTVNNKKGWLVGTDEELYINVQQKLYKEVRKQLETNESALLQSQERVCSLLQSYFLSLGLRAQCNFGQEVILRSTEEPITRF